jgi:hypothetical protein
MADRRLWVGAPSLPLPPEKTMAPEEAARAALAARIGALNDSMRLAEEAAARATDWTVKDANGGRWGVSPAGIHLGGITIPIPVQFSAPPGRRDAVNDAVRNWSEIQQQRGRAAASEDVKDRIKAVRERKAAERRDTTRSGGSD